MHTQTKINCCICGQAIRPNSIGWRWGNNPAPLGHSEEDRCCDECDASVVNRVRLMFIKAAEQGVKLFLVNGKDEKGRNVDCFVIAPDADQAPRLALEKNDMIVLSVEDLGGARAE